MRSVKLILTLLEYDFPQVFVAQDLIGSRYACMLAEINGDDPLFLCVPISDQRFKDLCSAKIDLRMAYEFPEVNDFYTVSPNDLTQSFSLLPAQYSVIPEYLLPDSGLVFDYEDEVSNKAQELRSTVAYASLSVPEAANEPRIRTRKLSEFLAIYQSVIRNLARAAAKAIGKPIPKEEDPYEADVFGFSYGSFTVQVRSADSGDILGENRALISAFTKLNEFLNVAANPDDAVKFLLSVKGHAASSLMNLLNFVSENDCQLTNRWSTPGMHSSSMGKIRVASAQNIIQKCRQREDLSTEMLDLVGVVDSADVSARTWKIIVDGVSYSGSVKEGSDLNLAGITLGNRYSFRCEEKIEIVSGTGREIRKLSLTSFIGA
ncbi:MAG TPA: hypothetical protein DDZ74_00710 [Pseudomonas sp.]|nr:hypothetical protein [Pseudomonas sp.]